MKPRPMPWVMLLAICLGIGHGPGCGQRAGSGAAPEGQEVRLPPPRVTGQMTVEQALAQRRSVRQFTPRELTIEQIGQLVWAAQGITDRTRGFRTAPSAGALYPLEVYVVKGDGLFRYLPQGHKLVRRFPRDLRAALSEAALGQASVREAPVDIVITGIYQRTAAKYGPRAERYVHLEAGHVGQNIQLQAVALGLGSVTVGAFDDRAVAKVLSLAADEQPLYIIPVGHPR